MEMKVYPSTSIGTTPTIKYKVIHTRIKRGIYIKHQEINLVKNKITSENVAYTPKYKTEAHRCSIHATCKYSAVCGHAKPHNPVEKCEKACHRCARCWDVSAFGHWPNA